MKRIATVNVEIPTLDCQIGYFSKESLLDYDIVIIDPSFPDFNRINFDGGGSCIAIESTKRLDEAMKHWSSELQEAAKLGKTIFVILSSYEEDRAATSFSSPRKGHRNYSTSTVINYSILPLSLRLRNAEGNIMIATDPDFSNFQKAVEEISRYQVVIQSKSMRPTFTTRDGKSSVGAVFETDYEPGKVVLLPYFSFYELEAERDNHSENWSEEAILLSHKVVAEIVAIDRSLSATSDRTARPSWVDNHKRPDAAKELDTDIGIIEAEVEKLTNIKAQKINEREEVEKYAALLFENGKHLENIVESSLELLGYQADNYVNGDIEIDHIILGPNGSRLIGETEGKDSAAIGIGKFRQLESNINEDFARDDVEQPAKGILFGNGHRLLEPKERPEAFTAKCLTNASRLGTALVNTVDLYGAVIHCLNNTEDSAYKQAVRNAIENTNGAIVQFPVPIEVEPGLGA